MRRLLFISVVIGLLILLITRVAAAEPPPAPSDPSAWVVVVPARCEAFAPLPPETAPQYWDQVMSLASCLESSTVVHARPADDLPGLLDALALAVAPAIVLYHEALDGGPPVVRLRAAYHIGLACVALTVRARATVTNPELRERLEPMLEPSRDVARMAFTIVVRRAATDATLTRDPVTRRMVRAARAQLRALGQQERELLELVR